MASIQKQKPTLKKGISEKEKMDERFGEDEDEKKKELRTCGEEGRLETAGVGAKCGIS